MPTSGKFVSFGAAAPAGNDTEVQFNDGGFFGSNSAFTYTKGTGQLAITTTGSGAGILIGAKQWYDNTNELMSPDHVRATGFWTVARSSVYDNNFTHTYTGTSSHTVLRANGTFTGAITGGSARILDCSGIYNTGTGSGLAQAIFGAFTIQSFSVLTVANALQFTIFITATSGTIFVLYPLYGALEFNSSSGGVTISTVSVVTAYTKLTAGTHSAVNFYMFAALDVSSIPCTTKVGMEIQFGTLAAGTVTNVFGVRVDTIGYGTNRYGISLEGSGTNNGIYFNARNVNLYAPSTTELQTDDHFIVGGNLTVGAGAAGTDYTITVNGETNDGVITWAEDEDWFNFSDTLKTSGGRIKNIATVSAATYDLLITDELVNVTYTATAAVTSLTLPSAQVTAGRVITIKDAGGLAATNNITIDTGGAETIDGASTYVINGDYESINLYSDGTNWFVY